MVIDYLVDCLLENHYILEINLIKHKLIEYILSPLDVLFIKLGETNGKMPMYRVFNDKNK